jgi:ATP-dependent DNA ligase
VSAVSAGQASGLGWIHEIKHDGYRLMARRDGTSIRLLTRNGNNWSELFPAVMAAVSLPVVQSCLIDGEVVVCNENGLAVFDLLRRGERVKQFLEIVSPVELHVSAVYTVTDLKSRSVSIDVKTIEAKRTQ